VSYVTKKEKEYLAEKIGRSSRLLRGLRRSWRTRKHHVCRGFHLCRWVADRRALRGPRPTTDKETQR